MEEGPAENPSGNDFLSPEEEGRLVDFYAAKLPSLIGPLAQVPRLRREIKVSATAALLYRRFYLSNSVMLYDPKAIMVASAFLASKVEDAMSPVSCQWNVLEILVSKVCKSTAHRFSNQDSIF